jgi:transcriptional regulator with XRE-family HTH domain
MERGTTKSAAAQVLAGNLNRLMAAHSDLDSNPKLGKKAKIGIATLSRLRNAEVEATLETLERLAKAFDVHVWQLLVPEIDPKNLPALQPVTEAERKLHERLRELAKELKEAT